MATIPTTGFLRLPQIMELFPISKSAWWKGCRTGKYPKPIKLGSGLINCKKVKKFVGCGYGGHNARAFLSFD